MTDQEKQLLRFPLEAAEKQALARVGEALGRSDAEVRQDAVNAYFAAGKPSFPAGELVPATYTRDQQWFHRMIRWWLRRPPATEVITPAALAAEARELAAKMDFAGMALAQEQLARLCVDLHHPSRNEALAEMRAVLPSGPLRDRFEEEMRFAAQLQQAPTGIKA